MKNKHQYLKNVTTLTLDLDKCISCGMCEDKCPQKIKIGAEIPEIAEYIASK